MIAGDEIGRADVSDKAPRLDAAFDALDLAAAIFDSDLCLTAANRAWTERVSCEAGTIPTGMKLENALEPLTRAARQNPIEHHSGADLAGLVRSCVRDYQLPRRERDPLLLTATPVRGGGYLVTLRDPDRGRLLEESALGLLRDSIESLDLGMIVWDAGLIVRVANDAWTRQLVPIRPRDRVDVLGERLAAHGFAGPHDPDGTFTDFVIAAHRYPRRWLLRQTDGQLYRLSTFPTKSGGVLGVARDVSERQNTEANAQRLMSDAVQSLGDGIMLLDSDLRCVLHNEAFAAMMLNGSEPLKPGSTAADLAIRSAGEGRFPVPDSQTPAEAAARFVESILACRTDIRIELNDGTVLEQSTFPTAMGGYVSVFRDITDRIRAQQELEASERLTRKIVEELGVGVALYDSDQRLQINNSAWRNLMFQDLPLSEPGAHLLDEIRGTIEAGVLPLPEGMENSGADMLVGEVLRAVEEQRKGMEVTRSDGTILETSMSRTEDGGHLAVLHDITSRKEAERAAREADDLVRTIVDASPTTFLVTRLEDGKVIFAPKLSRERFGDIESARSFFLDPADRERYLEALKKEERLTDYPVRFRRGDGSIMDGLTSARIIEFGGDKLIVSSTRDISDQLAMQRELEKQRERAHQNEKLSALGGLLAGVAHELNNPLSIIVANAMMLEEDIRDPVMRRRIERLAVAAKRSGKIVKTFLAMARNKPMRKERAEINEILETALDVSGYGLRAVGAAIEWRLDPANPVVEVDVDQIIQVLSNLLINAEHALDGVTGPRFLLCTERGDDHVRVSISDNGPGVAAEHRTRIFEPYFTTKEVGEGTGVGLAFCHRIIENHGGSITLGESEIGGASFVLTLPVASGVAASPNAEDKVAAADPSRVLVLDDEPDVAETVSDALRRAGFEVDLAMDAMAALEKCDATHYDAILSDVRMPGMNGLSFLAELKKRGSPLAERLAFMSGDAMGQGDSRSVAQSGRPYIEKPAEPAEIVRLVSALLEERAP